jgi:hypothetical protein
MFYMVIKRILKKRLQTIRAWKTCRYKFRIKSKTKANFSCTALVLIFVGPVIATGIAAFFRILPCGSHNYRAEMIKVGTFMSVEKRVCM